jgi:iron complex outermembrane receptor protein
MRPLLPVLFLALPMVAGAQTVPSAATPQDAVASTTADRHPRTPDEIVVTANSRTRADLLSSVSVLSGETLQEDKRLSIGETLATQPGVTASSFGPTASRPILRGLGGDRVRVLTDGIGSFDASSTSADHAVVVNPLTAERIEVIRGPAALLYGSSAIGGVVNVIDTRIPRHVPDEPVHASLDAGYGTAAKDRNVAGAVDVPIGGGFVAHVDGSYDKSGDLDTGGYVLSRPLRQQAAASGDPAIAPLADLKGKIPNTQARQWDVAGGLAYIADGGSLGISVSRYDTLYGVPIRYSLEPGVEDEQPRIDLRQTRVDVRGEVTPHGDTIDAVRVRLGYANYRHDELEPNGAIATSFFDKGMEGRVDIIQAKRGIWSGSTGAQVITRDFEAVGDEKFVPPVHAENVGVFALQTLEFGRLKLEAGGRYEREDARAEPDAQIGNGFESRSFDAFSGSAGLGYAIAPGWRIGANYTHTERSPDVEELFSNGPHDGTQAYELGDPNLRKEMSDGVETFVRGGRGELYSVDVAGYYNHFSNYIFQTPTGAVEDDLPVYAYYNGRANQLGFEASGTAKLVQAGGFAIKGNAQADYVRITVKDFGPAPLIPPLRLLGGVQAASDHLDLGGEVEHDFEHDRAAPNETDTGGFTLVNAAIAWRPRGKDGDVTLRLQANNLFDVVARRSTSLLKDYAPLAGRDIRVGLSLRI